MPITFVPLGTDSDGTALAELHLTQGDDLSCAIQITQDGEIYPLTGYSALMQVRNAAWSTLLSFDSTAIPPTIVIDGALGTLTLSQASSTTSTLVPGRYSYDLELTSPASTVATVLRGAAVVHRAVSVRA